jgi:hypothetical protein
MQVWICWRFHDKGEGGEDKGACGIEEDGRRWSPLCKITSGKGIMDMKKQFIIEQCKDEIRPISN